MPLQWTVHDFGIAMWCGFGEKTATIERIRAEQTISKEDASLENLGL